MCSGSVIHAVHTNDMNQMGGLRKKMPITAYTMLCGCLAIIGAGIPFVIGTSGYYSKDAILEQALLYTHGLVDESGTVIFKGNDFHSILFYAVAGGAALTAFYMFRMWYMTFAGHPRDHHKYDHAHESPKVMTTPLIILAVMAIIAGWWMPDWSWLGPLQNFGMRNILNQAQPDGTAAMQGPGMLLHDVVIPSEHLAHEPVGAPIVREATWTAFGTALSGVLLATVIFGLRLLDPEEIRQQFRGLHRFLVNKWYFDEIYNFVFIQPTLFVSRRVAEFDKRVLDWIIHTAANVTKIFSWFGDRWIDRFLIDGLIINGLARRTWDLGHSLHNIQTGRLRQYVMFIVVGTIALFMLISFVWSWGPSVAS
jgi:NADH-quinone oxidoreductase subunit L